MTASFSQLVLSPDGRLMAALSKDDVVRVWDTFRGKLVNGFVNPDGELKTLAFASTGKLIAVGKRKRQCDALRPRSRQTNATLHGASWGRPCRLVRTRQRPPALIRR